MLKIIDEYITGRDVLFAFSDPAGAKQVLAFAAKIKNLCASVTIISNKKYDFYKYFGFEVLDYTEKSENEWFISKNIGVLVVGTSYPSNIENCLLREASSLGVFSLAFVDHWVNFNQRFISDGEGQFVLPNYVCVIDEEAKMKALEEGLPENKLLIFGNCYYDFLAAWTPEVDRERFLENVGLPSEAKYILYVPEPISSFGLKEKYGFDEIDGLAEIIKALRLIDERDPFLLIKGHPNQNHEVFQDYISNVGNARIKYLENVCINTLIYFSECVLGFFSNALIEAHLLKKKIVRPLMLLNSEYYDPICHKIGSETQTIRDRATFNHVMQTVLID